MWRSEPINGHRGCDLHAHPGAQAGAGQQLHPESRQYEGISSCTIDFRWWEPSVGVAVYWLDLADILLSNTRTLGGSTGLDDILPLRYRLGPTCLPQLLPGRSSREQCPYMKSSFASLTLE
jgi:hypothetical protein